jgi:hypothetical protein
MRYQHPSTSFTGYTSVVASNHIWQRSSNDTYRSEMQSRLIRWCPFLTDWWDVLPKHVNSNPFSALQGRSSPSITATRHFCPAADTASVLQRKALSSQEKPICFRDGLPDKRSATALQTNLWRRVHYPVILDSGQFAIPCKRSGSHQPH